LKTEIEIEVDGRTVRGELVENNTAKEIAAALPIQASPSFWGDEIYFEIPVDIVENEQPETKLEAGDLAYWPDGNAFCIFFGPTPGSTGSEPKPASPVTVIGELLEDPELLKDLDRNSTGTVEIRKLRL